MTGSNMKPCSGNSELIQNRNIKKPEQVVLTQRSTSMDLSRVTVLLCFLKTVCGSPEFTEVSLDLNTPLYNLVYAEKYPPDIG